MNADATRATKRSILQPECQSHQDHKCCNSVRHVCCQCQGSCHYQNHFDSHDGGRQRPRWPRLKGPRDKRTQHNPDQKSNNGRERSKQSPPIVRGYRNCTQHQISSHVSNERLREHETGRVAIAANKRQSKREPSISLANTCRHTFPLQSGQLASLYSGAIRSKSAQNKPTAFVPGIGADVRQV